MQFKVQRKSWKPSDCYSYVEDSGWSDITQQRKDNMINTTDFFTHIHLFTLLTLIWYCSAWWCMMTFLYIISVCTVPPIHPEFHLFLQRERLKAAHYHQISEYSCFQKYSFYMITKSCSFNCNCSKKKHWYCQNKDLTSLKAAKKLTLVSDDTAHPNWQSFYFQRKINWCGHPQQTMNKRHRNKRSKRNSCMWNIWSWIADHIKNTPREVFNELRQLIQLVA